MVNEMSDRTFFETLSNDHDERVDWLNHELKIQSLMYKDQIRKSIDKTTKHYYRTKK